MTTLPHIRDRLQGHEPERIGRDDLAQASVAVVLREAERGLELLFIERARRAGDPWSGHMAFPGGRMETHDADIESTALRETHEEVGIAQDDVTVIGFLAPMPTITGYAVTPVVGLVDSKVQFSLDRTEVEYVFEVPLPFLLDPHNKKMVERDVDGRIATLAEFHYNGERIWGATAFIILQFIKILEK